MTRTLAPILRIIGAAAIVLRGVLYCGPDSLALTAALVLVLALLAVWVGAADTDA
jgi:hypothetical protein